MNRIDEKQCRDDLLKTLGEHSAAIIHELRAPLAAIRAQMQTMERLLEQKGETSQQHRFSMLYQETERMSNLLNQYLLLAGTRPPQKEMLSLALIADDTAQLLRSLIIGRGINYSLTIKNSLPPLLGDERLIKQVLVNLITNAVDATPKGGCLEIIIDGSSTEQRVSVRDTGCGMDAATLCRVFEPFFTTKTKGSGLGLAICRQIAEDLGGQLRALSTQGRGSTFMLTLPARQTETVGV